MGRWDDGDDRYVAYTQASHTIYCQIRRYDTSLVTRRHCGSTARMRRASGHTISSPRRNLGVSCDRRSGCLLDRCQPFHAAGLKPFPRKLDHRDSDIAVDRIDVAVIIDDWFGVSISGIEEDCAATEGLFQNERRATATGKGDFNDTVVRPCERVKNNSALSKETFDVIGAVRLGKVCGSILGASLVDGALEGWA